MSKTSHQGFILHQRAFKNSSLLIDCFTLESGLVRVVANGIKRKNKVGLNLFNLYWFNLKLSNQLGNLHQIESYQGQYNLLNHALFCGLYLNELLQNSLAPMDEHPEIYNAYHQSLQQLTHNSQRPQIEVILRHFEITLLNNLGYGIDFHQDTNGIPINSNQCYQFYPQHGFTVATLGLCGSDINAIANNDLSSDSARYCAKLICRQAIDDLLNHRPLKSRELFTPVTTS